VRRGDERVAAGGSEPLEEDYLSDLYRLGTSDAPVRTGDIAQRLGVTPASAGSMIKRLARDGLVAYREYEGASLTAAGERAALAVVRRHRVVERFLTDVLARWPTTG
jgi:DtxR family Mn-dependent transcriptional regulator